MSRASAAARMARSPATANIASWRRRPTGTAESRSGSSDSIAAARYAPSGRSAPSDRGSRPRSRAAVARSGGRTRSAGRSGSLPAARSRAAIRTAPTSSGTSAMRRTRLMTGWPGRPARRPGPGSSSRRSRAGAISQRRTMTTVAIVASARPPYSPVGPGSSLNSDWSRRAGSGRSRRPRGSQRPRGRRVDVKRPLG